MGFGSAACAVPNTCTFHSKDEQKDSDCKVSPNTLIIFGTWKIKRLLFKVCAPHPCSLKTSKTDKSTDCSLCAPGPCVMMTRARSKSTNGIKDNAECKVCAPKPCIMKRSQSQSSDCKVCAPKPCVLKTKDKEKKEEECRYRVYTTNFASFYNHPLFVGSARQASASRRSHQESQAPARSALPSRASSRSPWTPKRTSRSPWTLKKTSRSPPLSAKCALLTPVSSSLRGSP